MTSAKPAPVTRSGPDGPNARRPGTTTRVLVLARVALVPATACYAVAVVIAGVVAALASGTTPGGEPGLDQAIAVGVPLWLAAHLVPLRLSGMPLGALPLVPALGLGALVAVVARGACRRLAEPAGRSEAHAPPSSPAGSVVATAAAAHAVIGVLAAALLAPDNVVDASPGQAGVVCGVLAGVAALVGVAGPAELVDEVRRRVPWWARRGLTAGMLATSALLTMGATLILASLLAHARAVADVIEGVAPQAGSGAGLTLLSALYLPNAVVGAASWVLGPGVSIGLASAAPTATVVAPLPPIPLLATMPSEPPPSWAGLVFGVPLAVGSLVGWRLAPTAPDSSARARSVAAVAVAALTAAILLGAGAGLAGGRLGAGPFDPVSVPCLLVAGVTLAWILVPGAVVALVAAPPARPSPSRRRPRPAGDERGQQDEGGGAEHDTTTADLLDDGHVPDEHGARDRDADGEGDVTPMATRSTAPAD